MLTADLVRVRRDRRSGELRIVPLDRRLRERALALCEAYLAITLAHRGRTRDELEEALAQVELAPRERLVAEGLRKLIEDRCEFDVAEGPAPAELRADLFRRAAAARRAGTFRREAVLAETAAARNIAPGELERNLYADLRGAHVLRALGPVTARSLVEGYDLCQAQAVLLRAVRVVVDLECASAAASRTLFRKLKFLRLLCTIHPNMDGGYRVEIDGPYSLFESVTKYGLQLALALPAIAAAGRFSLCAEVRWGKERAPLRFLFEGEGGAGAPGEVPLPDEVAALLQGFQALGTPWAVRVAGAVLTLPGVGVCVPDLVFQHQATGRCVFLEVLGFWSRAAVWRRVELVEQGLREPILFCVSSRLRVSEEALPEDVPAALYVYKGVISPRAVAERLDALAGRMAGDEARS